MQAFSSFVRTFDAQFHREWKSQKEERIRQKVHEAASSPRFCNAQLSPAVPAVKGGASQEVADDKRKNTAKCARYSPHT